MNSEIEPQYALEDRDVTVAALLKLGQDVYGASAPQTSGDEFLRDGGLSAFQYIEFIGIASDHFRITIPMEYYEGLDNLGSLANLLHCGELERWS